MGEWERAQEGEKDRGKRTSRRRVVRREDAEEEIVVRVTSETEESKVREREEFEARDCFADKGRVVGHWPVQQQKDVPGILFSTARGDYECPR